MVNHYSLEWNTESVFSSLDSLGRDKEKSLQRNERKEKKSEAGSVISHSRVCFCEIKKTHLHLILWPFNHFMLA